jgi:hypothetical protein
VGTKNWFICWQVKGFCLVSNYGPCIRLIRIWKLKPIIHVLTFFFFFSQLDSTMQTFSPLNFKIILADTFFHNRPHTNKQMCAHELDCSFQKIAPLRPQNFLPIVLKIFLFSNSCETDLLLQLNINHALTNIFIYF